VFAVKGLRETWRIGGGGGYFPDTSVKFCRYINQWKTVNVEFERILTEVAVAYFKVTVIIWLEGLTKITKQLCIWAEIQSWDLPRMNRR